METFTCQGLSAQETLVWPSHTLNSPGGKSWSDPENLSRGTKLLGRKAFIWGFQRETGKYIYIYHPQTWGLLQTTSILETYFQNRRCHELQTSGVRSPALNHAIKLHSGKKNTLFGSPGRLRPLRTQQAKVKVS